MKISVACCVYNGARFLDAQLRSLIEQSVPPDEIVIVDDGSRDGSVTVAERFSRSAPPGTTVIVERNATNLGVASNFEKAIGLTSGELVFLCDQDDRWHPGKVETMLREFERRADLSLLFSDASMIDSNGAPLSHTLFEALGLRASERHLVHSGAGFTALLVRNVVTGATAALRRTVFDAALPFPHEWIHDEWLAIIAASIGRIDFLDVPLIDYRQHETNQIGMRRLALKDKFARLRVPRGERYVNFERRAAALRERLCAMGDRIDPAALRQVDGKLAHAHERAVLPRNRIARVVPIVREVATGRYGLYSAGLQGIVRDCLEP